MGGELFEGLVADSPQRDERALRAACNSIKARIELWNGTIKHTSRHARGVKATPRNVSRRKTDGRSCDGFGTSELRRQETDPPLTCERRRVVARGPKQLLDAPPWVDRIALNRSHHIPGRSHGLV